MSATTPDVVVERRGLACHITIHRAAEHNTMTDAVMVDLREALLAAEAMDGVRAIVLTGAGEQTFCAGGKLKPGADGSPFALDPGRFDNPIAELFRAMDRCHLPIIARVNGSAFGGGVGLICACDFAIGVDTARFGTFTTPPATGSDAFIAQIADDGSVLGLRTDGGDGDEVMVSVLATSDDDIVVIGTFDQFPVAGPDRP